MTVIAPPDLSSLERFIEDWGLATPDERVAKRISSTMPEIQAFYSAMLPHLSNIIGYLNQFPLEAIPDADQPLAKATLALCEVDNAVSKWKSPTLETGMDVRRMVEKTSAYDGKLA